MNHFLIRFCLALCLLLPLAHSVTATSADNTELQVFKAQTEAKIETAKESRQKYLQLHQQLVTSQNERIEQINHQVDWLGNIIALGCTIITMLLVLIGSFAYGKAESIAKTVAKDEANTTSTAEVKKWFDDNLATVNNEINALKDRLKQTTQEVAAHAEQVHRQMDETNSGMRAHASLIIAANPLSTNAKPTLTETDKLTLEQADTSLQDKPESKYTFDDWNIRAFAAYAESNFALAAEYWKKAAHASQATVEQVAKALFNQGVALSNQDKPDEEIACYQQVVQRFGDSTLTALQEQVAKALVNQGVTLSKQDKHDEAVACYKQIVKHFGDSMLPALQERVAKALVNQCVALSKQKKPDEEIACYKQFLQCFGDSTLPALQEQVAIALVNQGVELNNLDNPDEAITCYRQVVQRFGDSTLPALQEQVAIALNALGFDQLIKAKRAWDNQTERTGLLTESLSLFERATEKEQSNILKPMVLGNVSYALWLLGMDAEVETPLREALTLGGEETFNNEIEDTKISTVPADSGFEQLVIQLWSEISRK
ncbi:MAG: tetratricopeptide repeat protein [Gallionella sp.]|jgi:tetratricopeptide (TPR) repeat protein